MKYKVGDKVKVVSGQDKDMSFVKNVLAEIIEVREPSHLFNKTNSYVLKFPYNKAFAYLNFEEEYLQLATDAKSKKK